MHGDLEPEEHHYWGEPTPTDLWEDMARLNTLYEDLCWDNNDVLDFIIEGNRIVIKNASKEGR